MENKIDILAIRDRLGLTQRQLAMLIDCDTQSVSRWERNKNQIKSKRILKALRALTDGK